MKSLDELTDTNCHWPIGHVGEPGFGFCGAPASRQPYCERHMARAYAPENMEPRVYYTPMRMWR